MNGMESNHLQLRCHVGGGATCAHPPFNQLLPLRFLRLER